MTGETKQTRKYGLVGFGLCAVDEVVAKMETFTDVPTVLGPRSFSPKLHIQTKIPMMIEDVVERWHRHLRGDLPGGLDGLLDDDVIFYSPIVFTPTPCLNNRMANECRSA